MANFVLQELPEEMSEGKKVVFPKMQTYSLHDYDTVIKNMRTYAGSISDGLIRAVFDALVSTMQSWMPLGHSIKIDGLGVFSLSLGFDTSTPSRQHGNRCSEEMQIQSGRASGKGQSHHREVWLYDTHRLCFGYRSVQISSLERPQATGG